MNEEDSINLSHLIESREEWAEDIRDEGREWALTSATYAELREVIGMDREAIHDEQPYTVIIDDHAKRQLDAEARDLFRQGAAEVFEQAERQAFADGVNKLLKRCLSK